MPRKNGHRRCTRPNPGWQIARPGTAHQDAAHVYMTGDAFYVAEGSGSRWRVTVWKKDARGHASEVLGYIIPPGVLVPRNWNRSVGDLFPSPLKARLAAEGHAQRGAGAFGPGARTVVMQAARANPRSVPRKRAGSTARTSPRRGTR